MKEAVRVILAKCHTTKTNKIHHDARFVKSSRPFSRVISCIDCNDARYQDLNGVPSVLLGSY